MKNGAKRAFWIGIAAAAIAHPRLAAAESRPAPELVLQYLHSDCIYDISFAAHAPLMATAGGDGYIDLWSTRDWAKKRSLRAEESGTVRFGQGIALSPDGRTLARCAAKDGVELWDTSSGRLSSVLGKGKGQTIAVVWSPDGRILASAGRSVVLWNASSRNTVREIPGRYTSLCFSGDGRLLGAADESSHADIFDVGTGRKVRSLRDKSGAWMPIAISRDGRFAATAGEDPNWDPGPLPRDEQGNEYAPTESFYAHQLKIKIWDLRTGRMFRMLPGQWSTASTNQTLQFTPDGRRLFSGGEGVSVIWDIRTGRAVRTWKNSYASMLSPDGRTAAISWNGLSFYRVSDGRRPVQLHPPTLPVRSLAFSADGSRLAVGEESLATIVRVWDIFIGRLHRAFQGPPPNLKSVMFLPNGQVVGNSYNGIYVWDTASGLLVRKGEGPVVRDEGGAYHEWALLTPDGRRMISGLQALRRGRLAIWDWATRRRERVISLPEGRLSEIAVSPDGAYLAVPVGLQKTSVQVFDLATGERISELDVSDRYAVNLHFSPDGNRVAGYNAYGRVSLWDRATGRLECSIEIGDVRSGQLAMEFVPQTGLLAVSSGCTVRFFDMIKGAEVSALTVTDSAVSSLAFSSDGRTMAVGTEDGLVELWDLEPRCLILTLVGFTAVDRTRVSSAWLAWTPEGFYDWSADAERLIKWRVNGRLFPAHWFAGSLRRGNLLRFPYAR